MGGLAGDGEVQKKAGKAKQAAVALASPWRRLSSESASLRGLGDPLQLPKEDLVCAMRVLPEASAV